MEIIISERWNYQLVNSNGEYIFYVLCGGVGTFELAKILKAEEIEDFKKNGKYWCDNMAKLMQSIISPEIGQQAEEITNFC
jgi:hypothetical protein